MGSSVPGSISDMYHPESSARVYLSQIMEYISFRYPTGFESNDWYRIRDEKTLQLLCSSLLTNGYRESSLLNSVKGKWEDIIASLYVSFTEERRQ